MIKDFLVQLALMPVPVPVVACGLTRHPLWQTHVGDDDVVEITREQWDADAALKAAWDDSSDEWEESCTLRGWEEACTAFEAAAKARTVAAAAATIAAKAAIAADVALAAVVAGGVVVVKKE